MVEVTLKDIWEVGQGPALEPGLAGLKHYRARATVNNTGADTCTFPGLKVDAAAIKSVIATGRAAAVTVIAVSNNAVVLTVTNGTICDYDVLGVPA